MVESYQVVCDDCKEFCDIIGNMHYHVTFVYEEDNADLINAFLNKHYGCKLRLIHLDTDLEFLFNNNYEQVDRFNLSEEERKKYVLENNKMLNEKDYEKRRLKIKK